MGHGLWLRRTKWQGEPRVPESLRNPEAAREKLAHHAVPGRPACGFVVVCLRKATPRDIQTVPLGPRTSSGQRMLVSEDGEPEQTPPICPPLASAPARALGALQPRDPEALLHPGKHPGHPKSGPASAIRKLTLAQPKGPRPPSKKQGGQCWPGHWAAETWGVRAEVPVAPTVNGLSIPFTFTSSERPSPLSLIELLLSASDLNSKVY